MSRGVLDREMRIQQRCLPTGQQGFIRVQVGPTCLNHPNARIGEGRQESPNEIGGRDEVGIENQDVAAAREGQTMAQCAGLEAAPVRPAHLRDIYAACTPVLYAGRHQPDGLVRGVIQHLYLEQVFRIVQRARGIHESLHHVRLVEHGELDCHRA